MIVGIDLGTTNSLIGTFRDGKPVLFPNALGDFLTPSVVNIAGDGGTLVGAGARDKLIVSPEATVGDFKRWMGSSRETALGGRALRAEQLSALVLKSLIADAEAATGARVLEAVISVPAYFSDAQRQATKLAGELAGIKVERLINEPTAAALAYGLGEKKRDGGRFLVFDLGGGTLDVSIIEMFEGVVEVRASAGDNYLGGNDFLDLLVAAAIKDLGLSDLGAADAAQLRRRVEAAKRLLSRQQRAGFEASIGGRDVSWSIDEARFAELATPLIDRMRAPLERALRDTNLSSSEIEEVVLVGGASRMPLVARMVTRLTGKLPLRHVDPDQAIALGAVIASGLKARDIALEEVILTDVCPYTLGTDVVRRDSQGQVHTGYLLPIIQRNSSVPISREEEIWPIAEDQTAIHFGIFQGENPIADKNVKLGELRVAIPPGKKREDRGVLLRYTYDVNGILQVTATVKATGEKHEMVLEQRPGALSAEAIRERLAAIAHLKIHPRDVQENLALLARAERLFEELLVHRAQLQDMIIEFKSVLDRQDVRHIDRVRRELTTTLDHLEGSG
jgi:molecular chaperone HscC